MTADTTWVELPDSRYPILFETGSLSHRASAPNRLKEFVGESVLIVSNQTIADRYAAPLVDMLSCLLYTSPSPRDGLLSRMPSSA